MSIINGTGKYEKFIGYECPYGVNYKKNMLAEKQSVKLKLKLSLTLGLNEIIICSFFITIKNSYSIYLIKEIEKFQ